MARFRFLAAALLVFGTSVPGSWSWSMTVAFAPRAGPGPRTSMHALQPMRRQAGCRVASVGGRRAVGAVALQMAGSGAFLRVQQMQSRLKSLKVPCVICLPAAAPCGWLLCTLSQPDFGVRGLRHVRMRRARLAVTASAMRWLARSCSCAPAGGGAARASQTVWREA